MSKWKIYLKHKLLPINKFKKVNILFTGIFLLIVTFFIVIFFYKRFMLNSVFEANYWAMGLNFIALFICFLWGASLIDRFINSKEFEFLSNFSLSRIDKIYIFIIKTFWINIMYIVITLMILEFICKRSFYENTYILLSLVAIFLIMSFAELIIIILIRKLRFIELKFIFTASSLIIFSKLLIIDLLYKNGFNDFFENYLIYLGKLKFVLFLFTKFTNPSINQGINILMLLTVTFFILLFFINSNDINTSKSIIKYNRVVFFNKSKKISPIKSFLLKDIILVRKVYLFIILQILFIFIYIMSVISISKAQSSLIFILCAIFTYLFLFISVDMFNFETNHIWIIKSLPISNKHFFMYKVVNSYIVSITTPIIILLISLLLNKILVMNFFIYILSLLIIGFLFCVTLCSIVYVLFPKTEGTNALLLIINFVILIFPPIMILVIILCLRSTKNKLNDIEV